MRNSTYSQAHDVLSNYLIKQPWSSGRLNWISSRTQIKFRTITLKLSIYLSLYLSINISHSFYLSISLTLSIYISISAYLFISPFLSLSLCRSSLSSSPLPLSQSLSPKKPRTSCKKRGIIVMILHKFLVYIFINL